MNLAGLWRFCTEDNSDFATPGYNDSSWKTMFIPSNWFLGGLDHHGVVWFRYEFRFVRKAIFLPFISMAWIISRMCTLMVSTSDTIPDIFDPFFFRCNFYSPFREEYPGPARGKSLRNTRAGWLVFTQASHKRCSQPP